VQVSDVDLPRLRRLAGLRAPGGARVLSVFVNLDPQELGIQPARSSAMTSVLDEADRRERDLDLDHAARQALRADVARAREALTGDDFSAKGAQGLALYACEPAGLFELLRLPQPVDAEVIVDETPHVAPLVGLATRERIAVLLVSRRSGRILEGTVDALREVEQVQDDTHGQHQQGGWSQLRYERSVDEDTKTHLRRAADVLLRRFQRRPFARLLIGAADEMVGAVRDGLHPYLRERVAGRIPVDVDLSSPDDVREAARAVLEEIDRERERELLSRLVSDLERPGRSAAGGLDDVLGALNEQRVETLLYADGFAAKGVIDPRSGWLGVAEATSPIDGGSVEERANVLEDAVHAAILQSAELWRVRFDADALRDRDGIAAILRF
jgi:peptide chain release factor subunit 1